MKLLAHRMATENTWDQTAYNEEVGLPARLGHSGAGITRRAANYYCFVNSKTLYRKVPRDPTLRSPSTHLPVVLHVNYHQPKPPKMHAAYQLYHAADDGPAKQELAREPTALLNTTVLEEEAWIQLNGGYIGGRSLDLSAQEAVGRNCNPTPPQLDFVYELHTIHPAGAILPSCENAHAISCDLLMAVDFGDTPQAPPLRAPPFPASAPHLSLRAPPPLSPLPQHRAARARAMGTLSPPLPLAALSSPRRASARSPPPWT